MSKTCQMFGRDYTVKILVVSRTGEILWQGNYRPLENS